jgi:DNA-directed RNA polymerase I, II, and III subunit RPABC5
VLADKYEYYLREVRAEKLREKQDVNAVIYLTKDFAEKTVEGRVMDRLQLNNICCRRHFLTHVDIE